MSTSQSTAGFSSLPTEIRLMIYYQAIPQRTLQLGFDFPFPCIADLDVSPTTPIYDRSLMYRDAPVITRPLPTIFHLTRESRAIALSEYLPFSYSYLHPVHDTLYVSEQASQFLGFDGYSFLFDPTVHFYPLAALERMAIEYDRETPSLSFTMMDDVGGMFSRFGAPKEILLVVHDSSKNFRPFARHFKGYEGLELIPLPKVDDEEVRLEVARRGLMRGCGKTEWVEDWEKVKLTFMDLIHEGVIFSPFTRLSEEGMERAYATAGRVLEEWRREEFAVYARNWNNRKDGDWNGRKNVERLFQKKGLKCPWLSN